MSPLRSFCLERLTFLASCPRPESVISEDSDLATCNWSMIRKMPRIGQLNAPAASVWARTLVTSCPQCWSSWGLSSASWSCRWLTSWPSQIPSPPGPARVSAWDKSCFKMDWANICAFIYLWISCLCEMIMFSLSCKTWLSRTCSLFKLPEIKFKRWI